MNKKNGPSLGHNKKSLLKSEVEHIDITSFDSRKIIESMKKMSFTSRDTAKAAEIYNEMINFWREKYPMSLIEVDYDKFVLDYETNSKSVISKIGLNWENEIFKFYENNRAVETNSLLQVRSKVYQDSSRKWKKYEKHLKPIIDILKNNNIEF